MIPRNKTTLVTVGFAILALVLGYAVYVKSLNPNRSEAPKKVVGQNDDVRAAILNPPRPGASKEDVKKHIDLVISNAKTATELDISNCTPKPLVFRTQYNKEFKVVNRDTTERSLVINADHRYSVPPGGSINVLAKFSENTGAGVYGFGCDQQPDAVGMLYIVP